MELFWWWQAHTTEYVSHFCVISSQTAVLKFDSNISCIKWWKCYIFITLLPMFSNNNLQGKASKIETMQRTTPMTYISYKILKSQITCKVYYIPGNISFISKLRFIARVWKFLLVYGDKLINPIRTGGGGGLMPAPTLNSSQFQTI